MLLKVGLVMMLIGFLMLLCLFAAAALPPSPPAADESGPAALEAAIKFLRNSGVNVGLLAFCIAFAAAVAIASYL